MTHTHTITWTLGNSKTATVTVDLVTERHVGTVHGRPVSKPCCRIEITAAIEGMGEVGTDYQRVTAHHQGLAAKCGRLGIMENNAARIDAAIAAIEAGPEWTAEQDRIAQRRIELDKIDAANTRIDRAMGQGWSY